MNGPRRTRYVVIPGEIVSATDGDRHWIGAGTLLHLYRVPPNASVLILDGRAAREGYRPSPDDYVIEPRPAGDYPLFLP